MVVRFVYSRKEIKRVIDDGRTTIKTRGGGIVLTEKAHKIKSAYLGSGTPINGFLIRSTRYGTIFVFIGFVLSLYVFVGAYSEEPLLRADKKKRIKVNEAA